MKTIMTFAVATGAALALSACGAKKEEEAPAAEPTAEEMMAPADAGTPAAEATDEAAAAAAGQEGTANPIGPGAAAPEAGAQ